MNKKTNYILRLVLGMYLTFIGINLVRETIVSRPSDLAFKIFMGVIFIIIGVGYAIWIIKRMLASKKAELEEQKREEAAENALRKMQLRKERVSAQSRTAPMPSSSQLEAGIKKMEQKEAKDNDDAVSRKDIVSESDVEQKPNMEEVKKSAAKETIVRSSVSLDIDDDTEDEEETDYEEK